MCERRKGIGRRERQGVGVGDGEKRRSESEEEGEKLGFLANQSVLITWLVRASPLILILSICQTTN